MVENAERAMKYGEDNKDYVDGSLSLSMSENYTIADNKGYGYRPCDIFRVAIRYRICLSNYLTDCRELDKSEALLNKLFGTSAHPLREKIKQMKAECKKKHSDICVKWSVELAKRGDIEKGREYHTALKLEIPDSPALKSIADQIQALEVEKKKKDEAERIRKEKEAEEAERQRKEWQVIKESMHE